VVQQVIQDNAAVTALQGRVTALEQLDRPQLPSEESLAAWARAAERVGLSHAELAATQEATVKVVEQVGADAETRLDQLDAQQQALIEQVTGNLAANKDELNASILASQAQLAEFETEAEARAVANAETKAMSAAREEARRLMPNYAGIASVTCTEDPLQVDDSWNDRWLGRKPKVGDTAWVVSKSGITFRRYINGGWSADAPELEPRVEVASQPLAILDQSTHAHVTQNIVRPGSGGGGGGGENLVNDSVTRGGAVIVADTSNWTTAGHENPRSGNLFVEVIDVTSGQRGSIHAAIQTGNIGGETRITESGMLGTLFEKGVLAPDVDVDALVGPAVVPGGLTGVTALPGANRTYVTVRIGSNTGIGGPYELRGKVFWNLKPMGRALDLDSPGVQPAWIWG